MAMSYEDKADRKLVAPNDSCKCHTCGNAFEHATARIIMFKGHNYCGPCGDEAKILDATAAVPRASGVDVDFRYRKEDKA